MQSPREHTDDDGYAARDHELCVALAHAGFGLAATVVGMLDEHYTHRTERRGCGYTQATRHLAALVNRPDSGRLDKAAGLFPTAFRGVASWSSEASTQVLDRLEEVLEHLPRRLQRPESRLLAHIISDLVSPHAAAVDEYELPFCAEPLAVGTCPLAEKYFLEISAGWVRRRGAANVLVSDAGDPLLVEKMNLGENHSCINVRAVVLNGVRLPPGCLLAVRRDEDAALRPNRELPGRLIPVRACDGFRLLRLTTLVVDPADRPRAFSEHFRSQVEAGLYAPGDTTVEQLLAVARRQV